ncbi:hypothetical protein RBSWK_06383 [Rhodopirellula baltica SWK14]|uniref:Uncharacterized protein n=1 Tax=Rhodopirellula baltica SWK14 TaxID=993516 RepID=L7C7M3_RHOBT|nr:hypothetical protein RBSWK_06383 [Rhodopirellula baltica SWK14]
MKLTAELNLIGHSTRSPDESDRSLSCFHPSKLYAANVVFSGMGAPLHRLGIKSIAIGRSSTKLIVIRLRLGRLPDSQLRMLKRRLPRELRRETEANE